MEEEDEIVELFVQTQTVAYSSEMARRRLSEQEDEEERDKAPTPLHFNDLPDIMILQIFTNIFCVELKIILTQIHRQQHFRLVDVCHLKGVLSI